MPTNFNQPENSYKNKNPLIDYKQFAKERLHQNQQQKEEQQNASQHFQAEGLTAYWQKQAMPINSKLYKQMNVQFWIQDHVHPLPTYKIKMCWKPGSGTLKNHTSNMPFYAAALFGKPCKALLYQLFNKQQDNEKNKLE